jgi:hypothetical protein
MIPAFLDSISNTNSKRRSVTLSPGNIFLLLHRRTRAIKSGATVAATKPTDAYSRPLRAISTGILSLHTPLAKSCRGKSRNKTRQWVQAFKEEISVAAIRLSPSSWSPVCARLGLGPRVRFRLWPGFLYWLGKKHMDIQVRKKRFAARRACTRRWGIEREERNNGRPEEFRDISGCVHL